MKNPTIPMFLIALCALLVTPAHAAVTFNESDPISGSLFVPCAAGGAGELVDFSGFLHQVVTLTIKGNNFSTTEQANPQAVVGIGESTGLKYQGTGVTTTTLKGSFQNGQSTQTFINRFDFIGQGPGNNFSTHQTVHITVNANGTLTVSFDNLVVDCK